MTTTVTLKIGSVASDRNYSTIAAAWAAIPANLVTADVEYVLELYNDAEFNITAVTTLSGKTTDSAHTIKIRPAAGHSLWNNPNVLTNPLTYNVANGVGIRTAVNGANVALMVSNDWVTVEGIQFNGFGDNFSCPIALHTGVANSKIDKCLVKVNGGSTTAFGIHFAAGTLSNTFIELASANACGIRPWTNNSGLIENVTIVRPSTYPRNRFGLNVFNPDDIRFKTVRNVCVFNADFTSYPGFGTFVNCAGDGALNITGTNLFPNLSFADSFVSTVNDFRLKENSPLIDVGAPPSGSNTVTISGPRQQGNSTDIGAWEYPSPVQAPQAVVTKITVTDQTVVITGTTTGLPTSGSATLKVQNVPNNNAIQAGPVDAVISPGTFTFTFNNVKAGKYDLVYSVTNSAYTSQGTNPVGTTEVIGPKVLTVIQDPVTQGQVLTVRGTVEKATSGTLTLNPATGVTGVLPKSINVPINTSVTPNTFNASISLLPGSYAAPILVFTGPGGTSFPQAGMSAITVTGPSALTVIQDPMDGQVLTIHGTCEKSTGGKITVPVAAVNPNGALEQTADITVNTSVTPNTFTVSVTLSPGNYDAPILTLSNAIGPGLAQAGTSAVTVIGITGTPYAPMIDPNTIPTVSSVTIEPATATASGTFTATVNGTNSPAQTVTWATTAGQISNTGVFTAPASIDIVQTVTITATSTVDVTKKGTATVTIAAVVTPPVDTTPTVTGVIITPVSATVAEGTTQTFAATVQGTNNPPQTVTWTASLGSITAAGVYTPPAATNVEQTVVITAISTYSIAKSASAAVIVPAKTVQQPGDNPTGTGGKVSLVRVTPGQTVINTETFQFTAEVLGVDQPSQRVTWSTTLGIINSQGLLGVTAEDTAKTGTVIATSVADPSKHGIATFTVGADIPSSSPSVTHGTMVEMHFITPEGKPITDNPVEIQLKASDSETAINGIMMPRPIIATTDFDGRCLVELLPSDKPYYVTVYDNKSEAGLFYTFYVPVVDNRTAILRLQDIIVDGELGSPTLEEATMLTLIEARSISMAAAVRAENAAKEVKTLFDKLKTSEGADLVGFKTGTVADALNVGYGSGGNGTGGSGNGSGDTATAGEVTLPDVTADSLNKIDGNLGSMFVIRLTANLVLPRIKNAKPGQRYAFIFQQDNIGGRVVTYDRSYRFKNNSVPVVTSAPASIDMLEADFTSSGTGFFFCNMYPGYSIAALARIGNISYETLLNAVQAVQTEQTIYITRSGSLQEATASMTKVGTFTVAGAPELSSAPTLHTDLTVNHAGRKGILNVEAGTYVLVRDLNFDGAESHVDPNQAGVRYNPNVKRLRLERVKITKCQNGMLAGVPSVVNRVGPGEYNIEYVDCVFDGNGFAPGSEAGQTHSVYINSSTRSLSLRTQFLNAVAGHNYKSRGDYGLVDRCLIQGGRSSREIDLPNGGTLHVVNTIIRKTPGAGNSQMIGIGHEGIVDRPQEYIFRNCLLDNKDAGTFGSVFVDQRNSNVPIKFVDCVFLGAANAIIQSPFELIYTGGPVGPEGWDQTNKGNIPRRGTFDGNTTTYFPANQQPVRQDVAIDPTLVSFPATGSTATPSVRPV